MEDGIAAVWGYFEKAGVASAVMMSIVLLRLVKEYKEIQAKYEACQQKRIDDALKSIEVIQTNTFETKTLIELVKGLPR